MASPEADSTEPWLLLKANSGDVEILAMCVPHGQKTPFKKAATILIRGTRTLVEVLYRPQGSTESPKSIWRAWIAWRGHARLVNLDVSSICSRCGRVIVDVVVSPEGVVYIEH